MKRLTTLLVVVAVLASFVAACAPPTPVVVEKEVLVTIEVEKVVEKKVVETVEVEKVVEKEVVVTATLPPEPPAPEGPTGSVRFLIAENFWPTGIPTSTLPRVKAESKGRSLTTWWTFRTQMRLQCRCLRPSGRRSTIALGS